MLFAVVGTTHGFTIYGDGVTWIRNVLIMVTLLLVCSGITCFKLGDDARVELKDKRESDE